MSTDVNFACLATAKLLSLRSQIDTEVNGRGDIVLPPLPYRVSTSFTMFRAWCFTLNNPESNELPPFDKCRYISWQLEVGDEGTRHLQGYAELTAPARLAAMKKWLPTAHFEPRKGTRDKARDYTRKEESRVEGPWEMGQFITTQGARNDIAAVRDAIAAGTSKRELFEEFPDVAAKFPRYIETMLRYQVDDQAPRIVDYTPRYTWQRDIVAIVAGPADPRKIYWVYDRVGNRGKTYLAKHLVDKYNAYYTNGGKSVDLTYAYQGQPVVVFDYVRESKDFVGYGVIEQLKNGILMSTKYESVTKRFPVPHVIVFANFEPEDGKFSQDRLHLFKVYGELSETLAVQEAT